MSLDERTKKAETSSPKIPTLNGYFELVFLWRSHKIQLQTKHTPTVLISSTIQSEKTGFWVSNINFAVVGLAPLEISMLAQPVVLLLQVIDLRYCSNHTIWGNVILTNTHLLLTPSQMNLKLALAFLAPLLAVIPTEGLVCQDSVLPFRLGQNKRDCVWVREDPNQRCAKTITGGPNNDILKVETHCPKTCGLCDTNYCANTEMYFLVDVDDKGFKWKQCAWVEKEDETGIPMTDRRCTNKAGLKETCPETCGLC